MRSRLAHKSLVIESVIALAIAVTGIVTYSYYWKIVTGYLEPQWAYEGLTITSHNLMMLIMFGGSAAGIFYLLKKTGMRQWALVGVVGSLVASFLMVANPWFYAMVPLFVVLLVVGVVIMEKKKEVGEHG